MYNYTFFKTDVPLFIEVDYISMNFILLNYKISFKNFDYYNSKFLNIYLNRLYN